jgi:hypothetical protein
VWLRNLSNGDEKLLTETVTPKAYLALSRDASQVAYSVGLDWGTDDIYLVPAAGGAARKLCSGCGDPVYWFGDGRHVLIARGRQGTPASLDIDSHQIRELTRSSEIGVTLARLSTDDRWAAAARSSPPGLYIIPIGPGDPPPQDQWIALSGPGTNSRPYWSPGGDLLYFTSTRDGSQCIWAQRLDPLTKRPVGDAFAVRHSHQAGNPASSRQSIIQFTVGANRLVYSLQDVTGNLWSGETTK